MARILVIAGETRAAPVADALASLGHRVKAVSHAREALQQFALFSYDLVVLDVRTPAPRARRTARDPRGPFATRRCRS